MPSPRALLLLFLALPLALAGCPTERMPLPKDSLPPEDEWSRIPPSKEWLFATGEFSGPHKAECDHVLGWVKGEEACKASLCEHGRDLAAEWVTRCTALEEPPVVAAARQVQAELAQRAAESATDCGKRLEDLVRDGCGSDDPTCLSTGQRWATKCAKSEGTPLLLRILQRVLERKQEQGADPVKLDPRTCDELRVDVVEAGKCKDRFVCQEAIPRVETYRERCESEADRPTIATAVNELTVLVGGGKPPEAILVRTGSAGLVPSDVPVMLGDSSGGIIYMCEDRASDLPRYIASREACHAGKMVVARAFPTARGVEVRVGALDYPDDATFSTRYPTILAAGELERRDGEAATALDAELAKAADLARTAAGVPEAVRLATRAVLTHALAIKRSPALRAVVAKRELDLAPAFKEIAKAKLAASKGLHVSAPEAFGVLARARTRAFADLAPDGAVQIGAPGRGLTLDTAALFPRATEAYLPLFKNAHPRKADTKTIKAEHARGMAAAQACGTSEKKLQDTKKALVSCNFGLEVCDDARQAALARSVDEARVAAEAAFQELETARTGTADEAEPLRAAADAAGCREPWW